MPDSFDRLKTALADRYAIEHELGAGGMATVYLAEDLKHHRKVAVKVLRPELAAALGPDRFLREIEIAAGLQHPHILPLHDSGESGGFLYYVMPYVEGESLRDHLTREKQLPLEDALQIARNVAAALSYAHSHDVLHRDIKPENILLSGGEAVVADFGIARAISAAGGEKLTETGVSIGTPAYMSPEQAAGTQDLDGRSDLYSLACVLYEMLAGEPPHTGPTAQAIMAKRFTEPAPTLRDVRETIPEGIDRAVRRALAKVPADRHATAAEFAEALGAPSALQEATIETPGPGRVAGLYVLSSLAVLGLAQLLIRLLSLPDWVFPGVIVLLLVGLPILLATALVQRGAIRVPAAASHLLTWRKALLGGALTFGAWGVVVTGYVLLRGQERTGPETAPAGAGVAVLPFRVVGPDLELWREGMVDLLSTNLEGVAGLRKIDPRAVLSQWRSLIGGTNEASDQDAAFEVARAVGASYALTGSMVGSGSEVRLTADVYELETGELQGTARVDGSPDSLLRLVDRLSVEILRAGLLPAAAEVPEIDLSRVTTTSLDALKAYLAGEQKYRRSRFAEAIPEFTSALELDSSFALAAYRLTLSHRDQGFSAQTREYAQRAARLAERLPEREALLMRGNLELEHGRVAAIQTLEELTSRYPDDVEGWHLLGDAYYRMGGQALYPADEYRKALGRAIELSPYFGPAYIRLLQDGFARQDSAGLRQLLAGYRKIDSETPYCVGFELAYALVWGDSVSRERARAAIDTVPTIALMCATYVLSYSPDFWQAVTWAFSNRDQPPSSAVYGLARFGLASAHVGRGRIREAREILWEVAGDDRTGGPGAYALLLLLQLHLTGYRDTAAVHRAAQALAENPQLEDVFWLGALAADERRWHDVEERIRALESAAEELEPQLDTLEAANRRAIADALRGYATLRRGRREQARQQLEAVLPRLPGYGPPGGSVQHFTRYELGKLMLDLGDPREAGRYFRSFQSPLGLYSRAFITPLEFNLGQVYETLGETKRAKLHYDNFVRWWEGADPELQPWWQQGRQALIRLTRERQTP